MAFNPCYWWWLTWLQQVRHRDRLGNPAFDFFASAALFVNMICDFQHLRHKLSPMHLCHNHPFRCTLDRKDVMKGRFRLSPGTLHRNWNVVIWTKISSTWRYFCLGVCPTGSRQGSERATVYTIGVDWRNFMRTSSNENIFCVTGPLWGEFAGEFPSQSPVT